MYTKTSSPKVSSNALERQEEFGGGEIEVGYKDFSLREPCPSPATLTIHIHLSASGPSAWRLKLGSFSKTASQVQCPRASGV